MKFSSLAIIAIVSVSQVEGAKLHTLARAQVKAEMEAMNEQMELLQQKMSENQQQLVQMQSWWDKLYGQVKSWF